MVRLSTVIFIVVVLCLKDSLAMLTRGRFICHVHCLVHDGVVRSSPCGPHHENFGRNLYHMFAPAYFASQSLFCFESWYSSCFEVKCGFHTLSKRCSHISLGILNLLDHWVCHLNFFSTGVLFFKWIRSFQHPQDQLKSSQRRSFHPSQVAFVFPPSHPFSSRTQIS